MPRDAKLHQMVTKMPETRTESDALGNVKVPSEAYYGADTQRARDNFPISGIRSSPEFIKSYAMLKRAAALANMKEKRLDQRAGGAIVKACDEVIAGKLRDQFVVDVFQAGAGTSVNMNLNEVIANRATEMLGGQKGTYKMVHPNDHVNMSQSTNDTYHTATHMCVYSMLHGRLMPALSRLQKALDSKSREFAGAVKIGRTHLQDATPITLGQEFSGYSYSIGACRQNLANAASSLLVLPIGGTAVGTGIGSKPSYSADVVHYIRECTKADFAVSENIFGVQQNQNEEKWVSSALADLAIAINKISNDLRLMNSGPISGFGDISLPAVQPGSSIMPGKVNPSMAEMMNMVCFQVIGSDAVVSHAAQAGQLELNVFMPVIAYNLVFSVEILANGIDAFTERCVIGIKANTDRLKSIIDRDTALATALSPYIGYARAADIANTARREGKTVKQVCLEMKVMKEKELDRILDPKRQLKPTE